LPHHFHHDLHKRGRFPPALVGHDTGDIRCHVAGDILYPPAPRLAAPALSLVRLSTVGLLPSRIREGYGLGWSPRRQRTLGLTAGFVRMALRITPSVVRHWPAARRARRRAGRLA